MKKRIFILLSILVAFAAVSTLFVGQARIASAHESQEQEIEAQNNDPFESRERGFEIDSVIVTLSRETTRRFNAYSPSSFSEIGCVYVENLTQFTTEHVDRALAQNAIVRGTEVLT